MRIGRALYVRARGAAALVSEGFVSVTGNHISLSEQGRPFVRLIASVFDSYLQESGNRHSVAV